MIRRVYIERLVLRGTGADPLHAERIRALVRDELARSLDDGRPADAGGGRIPSAPPELVASPVARELAARVRRETAR